jgi:hypothetical protein
MTTSELKYLKNLYNVAEGKKMSETNFKRSLLGQFADAESPDLVFRQEFLFFQTAWFKKFSWYLFLPLKAEDDYCFNSLRCISKNEQVDFDIQISSLAKILNDSINVKEIRKKLPQSESKSIKLLSEFSSLYHVEFDVGKALRELQTLRSSGVAHRKGKEYDKAKVKQNIDTTNLSNSLDRILISLTSMLVHFKTTFKLDE